MSDQPDPTLADSLYDDESYENPWRLAPLGFTVEIDSLRLYMYADSVSSRREIEAQGNRESRGDWELINRGGDYVTFPKRISITLRSRVAADADKLAKGFCGYANLFPWDGVDWMSVVVSLEPAEFEGLVQSVGSEHSKHILITLYSNDLASVGDGNTTRCNLQRRPGLHVQSLRISVGERPPISVDNEARDDAVGTPIPAPMEMCPTVNEGHIVRVVGTLLSLRKCLLALCALGYWYS